MKQAGIFLLLTLPMLPLAAQKPTLPEDTDTAYIFHFVPEKEMFFISLNNNQTELKRLSAVLTEHIELLRTGRMYICVSSYAATGNPQTSAYRMAYLRNSRVKSELILRAGVTEKMFVTDRRIPTPYADSLRNVVVVEFPASVKKIEKLAGKEAAEVVRNYYHQMGIQQQEGINTQAEKKKLKAIEAQKYEELRKAEETRKAAQAERVRQAEAGYQRQRLAAGKLARRKTQTTTKPYTFALRANLLRWATLTPDIGVEWRMTRNWSILVDGTWTSWSWSNQNRRYALWEVSPAIHYYIGKEKRGYVGAMYHIGQFNYKLSDTGKQGDLQGGGIVGGYKLPINKYLLLDFNLGVGYTRANYDKYTVIDGVHVRQGSNAKNYWGINKAGVTLVFLIQKEK